MTWHRVSSPSLFLCFLLFSFLTRSIFSMSCISFSTLRLSQNQLTSHCSNILSPSHQVYLHENQTCLSDIEQSLFVQSFPTLWFSLSLSCRLVVARFQCLQAYPPCNSNSNGTSILCYSVCSSISSQCNSLDSIILNEMNPSFSLQLQEACDSSSSSVPTDSICTLVPVPSSVPVPSCESYQGSVCRGILQYSDVYIPAGFTQDYFEQKVRNTLLPRLFALAPQESNCNKHLATYFCTQLFMPCDTNVISRAVPLAASLTIGHVPFPRYPCQSLCQNYAIHCVGFLEMIQNTSANSNSLSPRCNASDQGPGSRYDCNGVTVETGQPNFPTSITLFSNSSFGLLYTSCNTNTEEENPAFLVSKSVVIPAFNNCPFPLVQPENYDQVDNWIVGSCALPCPSFVNNKDDLKRQDLAYAISKWFSTILICFLFFSYIIFPTKREHYIIFNFLMALFFQHVGTMSGIFKSYQRSFVSPGSSLFLDLRTAFHSPTNRCLSNASENTLSRSHLCGYQGFFAVCMNNAITCWWVILTADLYMQIVLEKRRVKRKFCRFNSLIIYFYGWFIPFLLAICSVTISPVTSNGGNGWICSPNDYKRDWFYMYGLTFLNIFLGCFFIGCTVYKMVVMTCKVGKHLSSFFAVTESNKKKSSKGVVAIKPNINTNTNTNIQTPTSLVSSPSLDQTPSHYGSSSGFDPGPDPSPDPGFSSVSVSCSGSSSVSVSVPIPIPVLVPQVDRPPSLSDSISNPSTTNETQETQESRILDNNNNNNDIMSVENLDSKKNQNQNQNQKQKQSLEDTKTLLVLNNDSPIPNENKDEDQGGEGGGGGGTGNRNQNRNRNQENANTKHYHSSRLFQKIKRYAIHIKLLCFLIAFLIEYIHVLYFKIRLIDWIPRETESATIWLECLLEKGIMLTNQTALFDLCGLSPTFTISSHETMILLLQDSTSGLVGFLMFFDLFLWKMWVFFCCHSPKCNIKKMQKYKEKHSNISQTTHISVVNSSKKKTLELGTL